jgi:thiol-disulfide isomerase/thioredoxin
MALLSHMVPIDSSLPDTTLPDLDGISVNLAELADGRPIVVMFLCNHCPYVRHVENELATLMAGYGGDAIQFVAISSNDVDNYPEDGIDGLNSQLARTGWDIPYLLDTEQTAAKAFHAACTPDFFVYGSDGRLAYRGAFDESNPGNGKPLNGSDLRNAIDQVLRNEAVPEPHRPSMGCGIKWRPGNEPAVVSFS